MSAVLAFTDADPGDEHVAFPTSIPVEQVMNEAAITELLFDRNHRRDTQQGCCDLCGRWDGNLQDGVGSCCAERVPRSEPVTSKEILPNAQNMIDRLKCAMAVVIELNDIRCPVTGIDITNSGLCTIRLARAPAPGFAANQHTLIRTAVGGGKEEIVRAHFFGCTLEWRNA